MYKRQAIDRESAPAALNRESARASKDRESAPATIDRESATHVETYKSRQEEFATADGESVEQ